MADGMLTSRMMKGAAGLTAHRITMNDTIEISSLRMPKVEFMIWIGRLPASREAFSSLE